MGGMMWGRIYDATMLAIAVAAMMVLALAVALAVGWIVLAAI